MSGRPKTFSDEELLNTIKEHDLPFCTAGELAEEMGVTNSAIHQRLRKLEEKDKISSKNVGARAKVWYLPKYD